MFWLRNKKNNFQLHTLIWGPGVRSHVFQMYKNSADSGQTAPKSLIRTSLFVVLHCLLRMVFLKFE